jgi:hypothetical protein
MDTPLAYHPDVPEPGSPATVLAYAERLLGIQTWLTERAAHGAWPPPASPADYLAWIEDEAAIQEEQAADHPDERAGRLYQALVLRAVATHLRCMGVVPIPLPWEVHDAHLR